MLVLSVSSLAQQRVEVYPDAPPDGSVVRNRPVFQLRYAGVDPADLRSLRLRIELRDERTGAQAYVFDQRRQASGWAHGEEGHAVFLPRRPIADGAYRWSAWRWNGHEWAGGQPSFSLRIDSVPPAAIDDLVLDYDRGLHRLTLSWTPVTLDRDGGSEFVARYRVYRHVAPPFLRIPEREVALTEIEQVRIDDAVDDETPLVFFSVAAEDEAGNRAGQRSATEP